MKRTPLKRKRPPRRYNSKVVKPERGMGTDSKAERKDFLPKLRLFQKAGLIKSFEFHTPACTVHLLGGDLKWKVDALVTMPSGNEVRIEYKAGLYDDLARVKFKIYRFQYTQGVELNNYACDLPLIVLDKSGARLDSIGMTAEITKVF